jgi:hypothetical protein
LSLNLGDAVKAVFQSFAGITHVIYEIKRESTIIVD